MGELIFWISLMLIGFMGSAVYSGLETGAYQLNRVRLHIERQRGNKKAGTLGKLIENQTTLLSTLLIGNNITNQLGTASLAVILAMWGIGNWEAIILNTIIVTPILFVFGETLPKDLFAAHAETLMYPLNKVLLWSKRMFTWIGLVPLVSVSTKTLMYMIDSGESGQKYDPRNHVEALMRESVGYGLLSDDQSQMAGRVLAMAEMHVEQEMIGWSEVVKVSVKDNPSILWQLAKRRRGSRYPVVNENQTVVGMIEVNDALVYEKENVPTIQELMDKPFQLRGNMPIQKGLKIMQQHHAYMGIVTGKKGEPIGIVTVKDLIEPLTGDLVML